MAIGAAAALRVMLTNADDCGMPPALRFPANAGLRADQLGRLLAWLWGDEDAVRAAADILDLVVEAQVALADLLR
jgi:hypothetical protein